MQKRKLKPDLFFLALIILILVGLPLGISFYDQHISAAEVPPHARQFILTGNAERGWLIGEVPAYNVVSFWKHKGQPMDKPVIEVSKGDMVVLKITSSDVVHGFSLKDFGIYLTEGIQPGKTTYVKFVADKPGTFTFSCNAICGDSHQNMQGLLVVKA